MRLGICFALGLLIIAQKVCADENLPLLKTSSEVYSNVTVLSTTATDVYFTYNNGHGMANAKLKDLSRELQKHFHYNAAKAGEVEQKQAAANARYHDVVLNEQASGLDQARVLERAKSENKMVLLDFTGSDWCPWCIKFDEEVLSTGKFNDYAATHLTLVTVDFPNSKEQSDALKQANQDLKNKYNVNGFPTFILLDSDGRELGRQVGYRPGGPDAFIAELDGFSSR
jgi:thioredoxin-related protein